MKYIAILLVALFGFTACGSDSEDASPNSSYLENIHSGISSSKTISDDNWIKMGKRSCKGLESGLSVAEVGFSFTRDGVSSRDAGYMVGAAVLVYCPELLDQVKKQAQVLEGSS